MELINQHTKKIMEGCKERAKSAGLNFDTESLEYIVTNRDLLELSPKYMIPTLYDYWVHDIEVLKEKGKYELYPSNPYETVINTRPAISFYNDNNPDWLNVMIFYHVLGHIDFFQNNLYFRNTWEYDFTGQALSDKRLISKLRSEKGRWVDYVIEFARGVDNLVGYYAGLSEINRPYESNRDKLLNFYFDVFLQSEKKIKIHDYVKEVERYNSCKNESGEYGDHIFFSEVVKKHPEFDLMFKKNLKKKNKKKQDVLLFLINNSAFLNKEQNRWMKSVLHVVRNTSMFFQPQIRTKILNEGWASYWHETLFLEDDRIKGHEVDFARVNAGVTSMPRVGINPYALGMRLFYYVEELADKGKLSYDFEQIHNAGQREKYDKKTKTGRDYIFKIRENYSDFLFINNFIDQDFVSSNNLFVAGKRINKQKKVWEYFVKSRKAKDYKQMVSDSLYHPPYIEIDNNKTTDNTLYLKHNFEGKPLVTDYIKNTMMGIEYLWNGPVKLETKEFLNLPKITNQGFTFGFLAPQINKDKAEKKWRSIVYTMEKRKITKRVI